MLCMVDTRYRKNAGAVYSLKYHIVFCPKYRRPVLVDDIASRLKELLTEKAQEIEAEIHTLEIMSDHVHLFIESDPTLAVSHIVAQLKGYTSRVMREEFNYLRRVLPSLWSRSYYAGSVGHVSESTVRKYIEAQKGR